MLKSCLIAALILFVTTTAAQQIMCYPRDALVTVLGKQGETTTIVGLLSDGSVIEILTSKNGSTFTIISSLPDGNSRPMAFGTELKVREWTAPTIGPL